MYSELKDNAKLTRVSDMAAKLRMDVSQRFQEVTDVALLATALHPVHKNLSCFDSVAVERAGVENRKHRAQRLLLEAYNDEKQKYDGEQKAQRPAVEAEVHLSLSLSLSLSLPLYPFHFLSLAFF
jgi:hypothetical protein